MAKPTASFTFSPDGLSITFKDGSSGIITSWNWDFGFKITGVEQISTLQNPPAIVFPASGTYKVSLTASNSEGSDTFVFNIVVSPAPGLNITILEMVQYDLPVGLAFDSIGFDQNVRKWQLYLQTAATIDDDDVFNENAWPSLWNVLISKLVVYDLVVKAATGSMASFIAAAESLNAFETKVITGTLQVADYSVPLVNAGPFVVNLIIIDGLSFSSGSLTDLTALLAYLNGLGYGIFAYSGSNIVTLGNAHILTTFNYTHNVTGVNGAFTQSNTRVVSTTQALATSGGTVGLGKGPLKSMETGPSKAAWYDSSAFWSSIFKSLGDTANGQGGGIFSSIISDACIYSKKLGVKMPFCTPDPKRVRPIQIARGRCQPFYDANAVNPPPFYPGPWPNWTQQDW